MTRIDSADNLGARVRAAVDAQRIWDLHTHTYPPTFGTPLGGSSHPSDPKGLLLWGIDELLTYHYLVAEVFRVVPQSVLTYAAFWKMTKQQQADLIWDELFLKRTPISEACRGVLTTLQRLGLDPADRDLARYRKWFAGQNVDKYIDKVMELSGVVRITMTNNVFDDNERERWLADPKVGSDPRFAPVLRFDALLRDWPTAAKKLNAWGYPVVGIGDAASVKEGRRFMGDWIDRIKAVYCAVSLPPEFTYGGADDNSPTAFALRQIVLPELADRGLPMAMMIGSRIGVNAALGDAGDTLGKSDVGSVARLCAQFPNNRFLITMLSRECQHELAVTARKFGNLTIFGCWWFLNNPVLINEITRMRMELLGPTFIPQHSDARVLDQLIYKWAHSRAIIAEVLADKLADTMATGWTVSDEEMRKTIDALFYGNVAAQLEK
jgi:hypothetical protein